jgi:hypothetical protein
VECERSRPSCRPAPRRPAAGVGGRGGGVATGGAPNLGWGRTRHTGGHDRHLRAHRHRPGRRPAPVGRERVLPVGDLPGADGGERGGGGRDRSSPAALRRARHPRWRAVGGHRRRGRGRRRGDRGVQPAAGRHAPGGFVPLRPHVHRCPRRRRHRRPEPLPGEHRAVRHARHPLRRVAGPPRPGRAGAAQPVRSRSRLRPGAGGRRRPPPDERGRGGPGRPARPHRGTGVGQAARRHHLPAHRHGDGAGPGPRRVAHERGAGPGHRPPPRPCARRPTAGSWRRGTPSPCRSPPPSTPSRARPTPSTAGGAGPTRSIRRSRPTA